MIKGMLTYSSKKKKKEEEDKKEYIDIVKYDQTYCELTSVPPPFVMFDSIKGHVYVENCLNH